MGSQKKVLKYRRTMGSLNGGIIIQKNNGFTEKGIKYRRTMGSLNGGIILQKNNGFTEQRYYNMEKQRVHRIEVL